MQIMPPTIIKQAVVFFLPNLKRHNIATVYDGISTNADTKKLTYTLIPRLDAPRVRPKYTRPCANL